MEINERVGRIEVRLDMQEREMRHFREDAQKASADIRNLAEEIRTVTAELRTALRQVGEIAAKPFDKLSWGWRVLVGIGGIFLSFAAFISSLLGAIAYFRGPH